METVKSNEAVAVPSTASGDVRMLTLLSQFQAQGWEIELCPPNLSDLTTFLGDRLSHIRWLKPTIFVPL
jgi:hypothetical protein